MVIKLKSIKNKRFNIPEKSSPTQRFTLEDVEDLFSQSKDWQKFYKANESKLWESKVDIYDWPVYPLCTKEDQFYRCILHQDEEVKNGTGKPKIITAKNIHYAEFISHCIYYRPEEHKQYIIEKLFPKRVSTDHQ